MRNGWKFAIATASVALLIGTGLTIAHAGQQASINREKTVVSAEFDSAPLDDVLAWLSSQEPNAVISRSSANPGARITLHLHGTSLRETEDAIADQLGGHWQRTGETMVFQHGTRLESRNLVLPSSASDKDAAFIAGVMKDVLPQALKMASAAAHSASDADFSGSKGQEDFARQMEAKAKELEKAFGPDFEKKMEAQSAELAQQSEALKAQFGPDFQAKMEKLGLEMQKQFGPDFEKKMEDQALELKKQFGPDFQKKILEQIKLSESDKALQHGEHVDGKARILNGEKLYKSLTPKQLELLKKNHKLHASELTHDQRLLIQPIAEHEHMEFKTEKFDLVIVNP